jgi:hypothetical protein
MLALLCIPDHVVIAFFTAVTLGQSAAIVALWREVRDLKKTRAEEKSED